MALDDVERFKTRFVIADVEISRHASRVHPLVAAAAAGSLDVVRYLLDHGVFIDGVGSVGITVRALVGT